jgi:hypothetical protein
MSILDNMLARVGKTREDYGKSDKLGKIFRRQGVKQSGELDRILHLPRRDWEAAPSLHVDLTDWLKTPAGTMMLRPVQAYALTEMHDFSGLLAPIRVGGGKTLISLLAAEVLEAKRPLLLIPAKLKRKTQNEIEALRKHWRFKPPEIISYEWLGRVQAAEHLDKMQPDLIISDETHKLRNKSAAVTRRVGRYMEAQPETKFVAMSGTITKRSLEDYAHIAEWCLGRVAPVPLDWKILREWCDAFDEKVMAENRLAPGALLKLCNDQELQEIQGDSLGTIRRAYRRRLVETPGVIATKEGFVDCSLGISAVEPRYNSQTEAAFENLKLNWETPDGWPISDPVTLWRHAREMALGLYYIWDPRPPKEWMAARKEWCATVRRIIKYKKLDSELQVAQAIASGRIDDPESERKDLAGNRLGGTVYSNWISIRDTFKPNTVPVWMDHGPLEFCENWMRENTGIVWVEHVFFGEALAKRTGRPFFHRKGEDAQRNLIDQSTPAGGSIIASIASNCEGRNLQAWSQNLVASPPPTGSVWEQLIARSHRDGQLADEVSVDVVLGCVQQWGGFEQARLDANYIQSTTGQLQKLNYADLDVPSPREVAARTEARWL